MRIFLVLLLAASALSTGCSGQKELVARQNRTIDSLYVAQRSMRGELYALQDSIRFYDDIDSGLYHRKQRQLEDRINKLEYLLAARTDTVCAAEPVVSLLVDELFKPASADLSDVGVKKLTDLSGQLKEAYVGRVFRVEGHSDNVPVGGRLKELYPSNWELSAARATSVVRFFVEEMSMDPARFEAVAFGAARPAASNNTSDGRRLNRRVSIRALPE